MVILCKHELGLAIGRRIVHQLGGDIQVERELGAGSVFRARIAASAMHALSVRGPTETHESTPSQTVPDFARLNFENRLVLVCDDCDINREFLGCVLSRAGADVLFAEHGHAAIDIMERTEVVPDLIITDIQMPVVDGYSSNKPPNPASSMRRSNG